ncbi:MAG: molybdopterin-guanine dinucleotide biosynthesis protein B [Burkholderiales bacterium]
MRVFGFAGWSGSGKTTLIERVIPRLVVRGVTVSLIKHAHHAFEIDHPGKDSYRHREAGCTEVLISSGRRWAVVHELRGAPELTLEAALGRLSPCDLVLVEGYKRLPLPKLEIHRSEVGKPWLHPDDPTIVAIASDVPPAVAAGRVLFALNAFDEIATFIVERAAPAASLVDAGSAPGVA